MTPTVEAFQALSRSSPWRWRELQLRHRSAFHGELTAWIRRPGWLRVRAADGSHRVVDERATAQPWPYPEPVRRADGLVLTRPEPDLLGTYNAPFWENYGWAAMLDPVEFSHHVEIDRLRDEELLGRAVWRADLRPVPGDEPRCGGGCCELLASEAGWLSDDLDDPTLARPVPEGRVFPDHHDVALDVQTGIAVLIRPVGGSVTAPLTENWIENEILDAR